MQHHGTVSLAPPAGGLSVGDALHEVTRAGLTLRTHGTSVFPRSFSGLAVMDANSMWDESLPQLHSASSVPFPPQFPQHSHYPLDHLPQQTPVAPQTRSYLNPPASTTNCELLRNPSKSPGSLQQLQEPSPSVDKHVALSALSNPISSYALSQQASFGSLAHSRCQQVVLQQQQHAAGTSPQEHPVRYDSELNMWVVVVPSTGSRHLLFASKFCVRKRGYAEARRRALASYQRFLQHQRPEATVAGCAVALDKGPEIVSHPSMFFSRAKEVRTPMFDALLVYGSLSRARSAKL